MHTEYSVHSDWWDYREKAKLSISIEAGRGMLSERYANLVSPDTLAMRISSHCQFEKPLVRSRVGETWLMYNSLVPNHVSCIIYNVPLHRLSLVQVNPGSAQSQVLRGLCWGSSAASTLTSISSKKPSKNSVTPPPMPTGHAASQA